MFLSMLKRSNIGILGLLLIGLTGCCHSNFCPCEDDIVEIPCNWHASMKFGLNDEDSECVHWWEALEDSMLTALVEDAAARNFDVRLAESESCEKLLQAVNTVSADVAKSYVELRGLQSRLEVLQTNKKAQNATFALNAGLSDSGFISAIDQNENKQRLDTLLMQEALIELSINKTIFHLSTLLGYAPDELHETLSGCKNLPKLPSEIPVGLPYDLVERHPGVQEAKKAYDTSKNEQAFYAYQSKILSVLEVAESALAAFLYQGHKTHFLADVRKLQADSFQLTHDLHGKGLKDEREAITAFQELVGDEDALIQSRIELLVAYVNLYNALSSGWCIEHTVE